jgi:hypothetical protein
MALRKEIGKSLNVAPEGGQDAVGRVQTLKRMLEEKLISEVEFEARKRAILDSI